MICMRKRCAVEAKWAPKLCVPAKNIPIEAHQPIAAILGCVVCDRHFDDMSASDWLETDDGRPSPLVAIFKQLVAGRAPPDFERAFLTRVSVNSSEYLRYVAAVTGVPEQ